MSDAAAKYLRRRGGNLFVWSDGAGMRHVKTRRPKNAVKFTQIRGDGWTVHVEEAIPPPEFWSVVVRWIPWPHLDALYDGYELPTSGPPAA